MVGKPAVPRLFLQAISSYGLDCAYIPNPEDGLGIGR
jgi:hypothetical protein